MKNETAILAAGCFWGVEELLRALPGVTKTEVGYCGGGAETALYNKVKTGTTNHAEAVKIIFDSEKISYETLLLAFFKLHNPTTKNQQGNDIGSQYRSAIFCVSPEQKATAEKVKVSVEVSEKWGKPIVTEIIAAQPFYSAEDYHQDYLQKNPDGYTCHYWRE
ncbi:MAG: peptide-methionine (S)-S-oxide reductase MsrA [Bdellovibrionaceae bacterium]|nr:peptide-methionine (S)-S-oxide reductase MsrA [Bdellovibrio sp.]